MVKITVPTFLVSFGGQGVLLSDSSMGPTAVSIEFQNKNINPLVFNQKKMFWAAFAVRLTMRGLRPHLRSSFDSIMPGTCGKFNRASLDMSLMTGRQGR